MFLLPLTHLRLLLFLLVTTVIAFASPLLAPPDAEYFGQQAGPSPPGGPSENFPALDSGDDVYHGSSADDGALSTTSNYLLDSSPVVNLIGSSSTLIAQSEEDEDGEIFPADQFQKFKNTRCGGEESVCCMGDRTYFSSGVGTAWPCSMSKFNRQHRVLFIPQIPIDRHMHILLTYSHFLCVEQKVRGAGYERVSWFFDSRWTNYCHAPKYFSTCEELKVSFPKQNSLR